MRKFLFLLICLAGTVTTVGAIDLPLESLQQANALLQAEYDLARTGKPYLLIDLQNHQLQLKTSGLVLQTWGVDGYRRWGHPSALPAAGLQSKSSLDEPERDVQVVNASDLSSVADSKPFNALELADMPTAYRMRLENGTTITVRPTPEVRFDRIYRALAVPFWYLSRPVISCWNFLRSSPYNELALSMSAQDARMLYWAFSEGTPCLIRLPAAAATIAPTNTGTNR